MKLTSNRIGINNCSEGVYLRWWFSGWHYFLFTNGYEIKMQTASQDVMTSQFFSVISKIERDTRVTAGYGYRIELHGITTENIQGFTGLLMAEHAEEYEDGKWREVRIKRGDHLIKYAGENGYSLEFEITRDELPGVSSVYQKSLRLYIGDTLCDIDDSEVIPVNKQVNDIGQLQDRNTDFTASFKIRKTRRMRALFELAGEVGDNTLFPYRRQRCRLVQDNIELITGGILVLDRVDDQYYHVSILSGNASFFQAIEVLSITDLTLAGMDHDWTRANAVASHAVTSPPPDYVYPLFEPTEDGGLAPVTDDGDRVDMHVKYLRPFFRLKTIWDEIFANAGYKVTGGEVLNDTLFNGLYLPIASLKVNDTDKYLYMSWWSGTHPMTTNEVLAFAGAHIIKGDELFRTGWFVAPYTAKYKYRVEARSVGGMFGYGHIGPVPTLYMTKGILHAIVGTFEFVSTSGLMGITGNYELEFDATAGDLLSIVTTPAYYMWYDISIVKINDAKLDVTSTITARDYLPNMKQTDFIKAVCHLFGLVPEVNPLDREVRFWNYKELYENIPIARDWSNYLSERDDVVEFKFGNYGRENHLKYKASNDVVPGQGNGILPIDDETLPEECDIIESYFATADEVRILDKFFAVDVARIGFNKWSESDADYKANDKVDPRIVYIDRVRAIASPPYEKTFGIVDGMTTTDVTSPLKASTLPVSFVSLLGYYAYLSRMLTRTKLRKMRFNLPVHEVAGLRHNVPVYLRQYRAYFYVNRVNNFVAGKLCTVDLIKLY